MVTGWSYLWDRRDLWRPSSHAPARFPARLLLVKPPYLRFQVCGDLPLPRRAAICQPCFSSCQKICPLQTARPAWPRTARMPAKPARVQRLQCWITTVSRITVILNYNSTRKSRSFFIRCGIYSCNGLRFVIPTSRKGQKRDVGHPWTGECGDFRRVADTKFSGLDTGRTIDQPVPRPTSSPKIVPCAILPKALPLDAASPAVSSQMPFA